MYKKCIWPRLFDIWNEIALGYVSSQYVEKHKKLENDVFEQCTIIEGIHNIFVEVKDQGIHVSVECSVSSEPIFFQQN